jgi:hypothetical protein
MPRISLSTDLIDRAPTPTTTTTTTTTTNNNNNNNPVLISLFLPCVGLAVLAQRIGWSGDHRTLCQRYVQPDVPGIQRHYRHVLLRICLRIVAIAFFGAGLLVDKRSRQKDRLEVCQ